MTTTALFKRLLVHTATFRSTRQEQDTTGSIKVVADADLGTVNCRIERRDHRLADPGVGLQMVERYFMIIDAEHASKAQEEYWVVDWSWRESGTLIDAGPFEIESVERMDKMAAHHIELSLEKIA